MLWIPAADIYCLSPERPFSSLWETELVWEPIPSPLSVHINAGLGAGLDPSRWVHVTPMALAWPSKPCTLDQCTNSFSVDLSWFEWVSGLLNEPVTWEQLFPAESQGSCEGKKRLHLTHHHFIAIWRRESWELKKNQVPAISGWMNSGVTAARVTLDVSANESSSFDYPAFSWRPRHLKGRWLIPPFVFSLLLPPLPSLTISS